MIYFSTAFFSSVKIRFFFNTLIRHYQTLALLKHLKFFGEFGKFVPKLVCCIHYIYKCANWEMCKCAN